MPAFTRIHTLNFFRKLTVNSVFFLVPLYFLKLGFPGWQIGLIMACYALAPFLFSFPVGWITDRYPISTVIRTALLLLITCFIIIGWTTSFPLMALLFLGLGLGNNALDVSTNSYFYKDKTLVNQNQKYGKLAFWLALGMALGTVLGGFLTHFADFRLLFQIYALILLGVFIISQGIHQESFSRATLKEYRLNLFNRKTLYFSVMIFILTLHWGVEGTVYSPFLKEHFALNNLQVSLYISTALFFLAIPALIITFIRFNADVNRRLFLIAMVFSGTGQILMVNSHLYVSFFFRVVHEIGDGFMGALIALFISRLFSKHSVGGSSGILLVVMTSGHALGSLLFSTMGYRMGFEVPFIVSGAILLFNAAYAWWVFRLEKY